MPTIRSDPTYDRHDTGCDMNPETYDKCDRCDNDDKEALTLAVAAKALGVTRRTVERYIQGGKLRKTSEGSRVYVSMTDVRILRQALKNGVPLSHVSHSSHANDVPAPGTSDVPRSGSPATMSDETLTLPLTRYNDLISEIAALKRQAEYLLEDQTLKDARARELEDARRRITEQERRIGLLEGRLQVREEQLARRAVPFWRRLFGRRRPPITRTNPHQED